MTWLVRLLHTELLAGRLQRRLPPWPSPWPSEARSVYPDRALSGTLGEYFLRPCRKSPPARNELRQTNRRNEEADLGIRSSTAAEDAECFGSRRRPANWSLFTLSVTDYVKTAAG